MSLVDVLKFNEGAISAIGKEELLFKRVKEISGSGFDVMLNPAYRRLHDNTRSNGSLYLVELCDVVAISNNNVYIFELKERAKDKENLTTPIEEWCQRVFYSAQRQSCKAVEGLLDLPKRSKKIADMRHINWCQITVMDIPEEDLDNPLQARFSNSSLKVFSEVNAVTFDEFMRPQNFNNLQKLMQFRTSAFKN